jgi:hypothetical protein
MATAKPVSVNAQRPHASPTAQAPTEPQGADRAIGRLASLVEEVAARLEDSATEPPGGLVTECNTALEACLESLRDGGDRDNLVRTARDDLNRLGRLLRLVDGADIPFVMRQIRRVLGRFDACGGRLAAGGGG